MKKNTKLFKITYDIDSETALRTEMVNIDENGANTFKAVTEFLSKVENERVKFENILTVEEVKLDDVLNNGAIRMSMISAIREAERVKGTDSEFIMSYACRLLGFSQDGEECTMLNRVFDEFAICIVGENQKPKLNPTPLPIK